MIDFRTISRRNALFVLAGAAGAAVLAGLVYGTEGRSSAPRPGISGGSPSRPVAEVSDDVVATGRVTTPKEDLVSVGSDFSGLMGKVLVQVNTPVKKGDLLAVFDDSETAARVREEEGRVREAEAQRDFARKEWERTRILSRKSLRSPERKDRDERNVRVAESRLDEERARLDRLRALEGKTRIRSPLDGIVLGRMVNPGEEISRGRVIFTIAALSRLRVVAEVGEFDVGRIRPGAPAIITADGFSGSWKARVVKVPHRVVPQTVNPEDPAAPVDIRVFNVRLAPLDLLSLPLGEGVRVRIHEEAAP